MKGIVTILLFVLFLINCQAQSSDIYIPANSTVGFFTSDSTAIFGNIRVDGTLLLPTKSFIYFFGQNWRNTSSNNITDESLGGFSAPGGTVRFSQKNTNTQQTIFGSYTSSTKTGTYFPNVEIDNPAGLVVSDSSDFAIRNVLRFINGKIVINQSNIVVGSPSRRGTISGYNQDNYIVTEGGLFGGFLYRLQILTNQSDSTVFPIGTSFTSYTPVSLYNHGAADNFRARVFPKVYEHGLFGNDISNLSNNKTWIVANELPVYNASIRLQHIIEEEGTVFNASRQNSYVSHLVSTKWDTTDTYSQPVSPGTITTGAPINNAAILLRVFNLSQPDSYFFTGTIKSTGTNTPGENFLFTARRINSFLALLNITVNNDNNVLYYEIQKRRINATVWTAMDTLLPANITSTHTYSWNDNDVYYPDIIQYRIRIIAPDNTYTYSAIRNIDGIQKDFFVRVFPNPGYDQFYLQVINAPDVENMVVYNNNGQALFSKNITGPLTSFNLSNYSQGVYYVVLYGKGKKIFTEKVIKLNR